MIFKQRGQMALILIGIILAASASLLYSYIQVNQLAQKFSLKVTRTQYAKTVLRSALETLSSGLLILEAKYAAETKSCLMSSDLFKALKTGHQCSQVGSLSLFSTADWNRLGFVDEGIMQWQSIRILFDRTEFPTDKKLVTIYLDDLYSVDFFFEGYFEAKGYVALLAKVNYLNQELWTGRVGVLAQGSGYRIHYDSSGHLVPEKNIPLGPCPTTEWSPLRLSRVGSCLVSEPLGGGEGLTQWGDQFFSLYSIQGLVRMVDSSNNLVVDTSGNHNGQTVFLPYQTESLQAADDFEAVGDGSGSGYIIFFKIGKISILKSSDTRVVCDFEKLGFDLPGISGLLVEPGSGNLFEPQGIVKINLKSDDGRLFYVFVLSSAGARSGLDQMFGSPSVSGSLAYYCSIKHSNTYSPIEFRRTYGFTLDRRIILPRYFIF